MQSVNSGPGASGDRATRPFMELRGAARISAGLRFAENSEIQNRTLRPLDIQRFGHGVEGDAPFSALSSEVVRAQWNGDEDNVANYFV
jgi:hypothetical protein